MNIDIEKGIQEFENRKKYDFFDAATLDSIDDDRLVLSIIDYLLDHVIKNECANSHEILKTKSIGFRYIYSIWWLEAEVNNGGFNQYYYNTEGRFAEDAYNGCLAVGAERTAKVVERSMQLILKELDLYNKTKEAGSIEAFMESYKETKLGECDDEYYKTGENLGELMVKYIRNNKSLFFSE